MNGNRRNENNYPDTRYTNVFQHENGDGTKTEKGKIFHLLIAK